MANIIKGTFTDAQTGDSLYPKTSVDQIEKLVASTGGIEADANGLKLKLDTSSAGSGFTLSDKGAKLSIAENGKRGGIVGVAKTADQDVPVGIGTDGKLYTKYIGYQFESIDPYGGIIDEYDNAGLRIKLDRDQTGGAGLETDENGLKLETATTTSLGGVIIGSGLKSLYGKLAIDIVDNPYTLTNSTWLTNTFGTIITNQLNFRTIASRILTSGLSAYYMSAKAATTLQPGTKYELGTQTWKTGGIVGVIVTSNGVNVLGFVEITTTGKVNLQVSSSLSIASGGSMQIQGLAISGNL